MYVDIIRPQLLKNLLQCKYIFGIRLIGFQPPKKLRPLLLGRLHWRRMEIVNIWVEIHVYCDNGVLCLYSLPLIQLHSTTITPA